MLIIKWLQISGIETIHGDVVDIMHGFGLNPNPYIAVFDYICILIIYICLFINEPQCLKRFSYSFAESLQ